MDLSGRKAVVYTRVDKEVHTWARDRAITCGVRIEDIYNEAMHLYIKSTLGEADESNATESDIRSGDATT